MGPWEGRTHLQWTVIDAQIRIPHSCDGSGGFMSKFMCAFVCMRACVCLCIYNRVWKSTCGSACASTCAYTYNLIRQSICYSGGDIKNLYTRERVERVSFKRQSSLNSRWIGYSCLIYMAVISDLPRQAYVTTKRTLDIHLPKQTLCEADLKKYHCHLKDKHFSARGILMSNYSYHNVVHQLAFFVRENVESSV